MTKEQFVDAIRLVVHDSTVSGTEQLLMHPPGRKPEPKLVQLSEWFTGLPLDQQHNVRDVIAMASESAVFGMLCVLDGVRPIEDDAHKGSLKLNFEKHGSSIPITEDSESFLHEIFKTRDL